MHLPPSPMEKSLPSSLRERAERVSELAQARHVTLATVKSCTAGSLVHLLAQAPGATETLQGSFVVYTKENKIAAVGVPSDLLASHTAVSGEVAQAMAEGGLARCPADIVASITEVAGPEPDEDGNAVGLVFVAAAARDGRKLLVRHEFGKKSKEEICSAAMNAALDLLEELLNGQVP